MAATNEHGVIAETYYELQGLDYLRQAREEQPLEKATQASIVRAVLQSVEIGLYNASDLLRRTEDDIQNRNFIGARSKLSWMYGFHRILTHLSFLPQHLGFPLGTATDQKIHIHESPACREYAIALQQFDRQCGSILKRETSSEDVDEPDQLRRLIALSNHETTIWEQNLSELQVGLDQPSYEKLTGTQSLRTAVFGTMLKGDTFFTQFRGLHQIPEIMGAETADNLEAAILALQEGQFSRALDHLHTVNSLIGTTLPCLSVIAENLSASDYHRIRENLGLTSGSHSVTLHYHLFRDLYRQLGDTMREVLSSQIPEGNDLQRKIQVIDQTRHLNAQAECLHRLIGECLKYRALIGEETSE